MQWFDFLFPPREDEIVLRNLSTDAFCARLAPQLVSYTRPPTVALLPFADPTVRAAIHEAKYRGSERAFALLSVTLADFLPDYLAEAGHVGRTTSHIEGKRSNLVSLVPVPLGRARRKERGFNQVEEVGKRAVRGLDIALDPSLLLRIRETTSQVSLARQAREENMRGAFATTHPADPTRTYILLDDVVTTGATLQAAIDTLVEAGGTRDHILPIALAH